LPLIIDLWPDKHADNIRNGSFTRELAGGVRLGKPNFTKHRVGEQAKLTGQTGASQGGR